MIDLNDSQQVKQEFARILIGAELVTPSQLDGDGGAAVGKFAANARRLRTGEISVDEFERIMFDDE